VDNFAPSVESVLVYFEASPGEPDTVYSGGWALIGESDRALADSSRKYLSADEEQWIGVALKLSEPMDSLPDVWITGEWGGEVRWSSDALGSDYQFIPCEWDELNLGEMPYELNGNGFWQCYRTELGITGYHGSLRLNIGGGMDLAGNLLDGDPATVAVRDPQTGVFSGHEEGVDNAYTWETAVPQWSRKSGFPGVVHSTNTPYGSLEVQLNSTYNQYMKLAGYLWWLSTSSCPYWHGFWMIRDISAGNPHSFNTPQACIIDFNGATVQTFELGNQHTFYPANFESFPFSHIDEQATLQTGGDNCLWVSVADCRPSFLFWGYTYSLYLNCFTASGLSSRHFIGSGSCYYADSNETIINDPLHSSGNSRATGYYDMIERNPNEPDNVHGYFQGQYFNYSPPGLNTTDIEPNQICLQDSGIAEASGEPVVPFGLSVDRNPVSSQLILQVSLEQAGSAELTIHDLTGREVQRVLDEEMPAGVHSLTSEVNLPSGVYFCRLRSGGDVATQKLVIVR
jgi:hypothetical protein